MHLKVHDSPASDDASSLCYTCRFATVITGHNPHDQIVECLRLYGSDCRVRFAVARCTSYVDSRRPSLKDFEHIAWVLRSDAMHKCAGFVRPEGEAELQRVFDSED
jgi:hypothetical protein